MDRPTDEQAPPVPNERPAVWPLVIADMHERDATGRARYGTPLQPHNGRNALVDAYQEALDLAVYLRQRIEEERGLESNPRVFELMRAAEERGLRRGFQIAEEHADVSEHNGWHRTDPHVEWDGARRKLAEAVTALYNLELPL